MRAHGPKTPRRGVNLRFAQAWGFARLQPAFSRMKPFLRHAANDGSEAILDIHSPSCPGLPRAAPDPPPGRAHGLRYAPKQWFWCGSVTPRINVAKPSQGRARPFFLPCNERFVPHLCHSTSRVRASVFAYPFNTWRDRAVRPVDLPRAGPLYQRFSNAVQTRVLGVNPNPQGRFGPESLTPPPRPPEHRRSDPRYPRYQGSTGSGPG